MPLKQITISADDFPQNEPDVQRTTFSVDVLGRFVCNTYEEATTNPDFDVIVIGSGMYGSYCAAKLFRDSRAVDASGQKIVDKALRILVLEAGPFVVSEHSQNLPGIGLNNPFRPGFDTFQDGEKTRDLVWGIGWRSNTLFPGTAYCVGGKSLYWGGWCPRLREADLQHWPEEVRSYLLNPPEFPSSFPNRLSSPDQNSVYEEVEFEIGVKPADDFVFDPLAGPNEPKGSIGLNEAFGGSIFAALETLRKGNGTPLQNPEPPPIAVQTQSFVSGVFSPDKFSSLTMLISAIRDSKGGSDSEAGIFLVPNAHVSRLQVSSIDKDGATIDGHSVAGIHLFVGGKRQFLPIKPSCTVVLAMGCFESTRLALESFPTAPQRGGDEIIGRNLIAHLRFDFDFTINRLKFAEWVKQATGKELQTELQTACFHLQADTPDGRFHLQAYATGEKSGSAEGLLYRMIPDAEVARRLASQQNSDDIRVVFRACGEMKGDRKAPVYSPGSNWVDLASVGDRDNRFDHARAYVHYEDQSKAPMFTRMREACVALAEAMGGTLAKGARKGDEGSQANHETGTTWHDSGTLFMGTNPAESVTDTNGHFHHMANVACVDQGLFPTVGSANPVLTGLCLSRKVAEAIGKRYTSEKALSSQAVESEKAAGFLYLLEGANALKWKANNPRFTADGLNPLILNDTVLEVHGKAGLGVLYYDDPMVLEDFELRLQWKAFFPRGTGDITANSGIFLRMPAPAPELTDANFYDHTIEVQIDDTGYDFANRKFRSSLHRTGAVYKIAAARTRVQKIPATEDTDGFWNSYKIIVKGADIRVELNGSLTSEGTLPPSLIHPGKLGLQYHTGKVQFRSIRIKPL